MGFAAAGGRSSDGPIDYVTATLNFANGVAASLTASKMSHRKERHAYCRDSLVEADFLNRTCAFTGVYESYSATGANCSSPRRLYRRGEHLPHRAALRRARALPAMRARCGQPAVDGLQAAGLALST